MFEGKTEKQHFKVATAEVMLGSTAFEHPAAAVWAVCDA